MKKIANCLMLAGVLLTACQSKPTLYERLSATRTGIRFANTITPSDTLNVLNYSYLYNGGGVGVGDFNRDGLMDVYFAGNQVSSKLYLNKGDFAFTDITETARVQTTGWTTGVCVADVNQDGWPDLYLSVGNNPTNPKPVHNRLFINRGLKNGVPVFDEMAEAYGLAEASYCTQAAFFDYDRDGDLDMYLLRNYPEIRGSNTLRPVLTNGTHPDTDKLFRNDGPHNGHPRFSDVSRQAGITTEGYGLGLAISDLNNDGWLDIYCANDFISNDLLYLNNQDGTFRNVARTAMRHQSYNGMGVDIADINNDTRPDIVEMDMLPESNARQKKMLGSQNYDFTRMSTADRYGNQLQYVRNSLQLNNGPVPGKPGEITFSEIGQLAGVDRTDWSWAALLADLDNDGWKDLYITNGYRKDVTDRDFIVYSENAGMFGNNANAEARYNKLDELLPEVKIPNYSFRNRGGEAGHELTFENTSADWGLNQASYSSGATYADLDNDGDLDLLVNNIDDEAFVYRNTLDRQAGGHSLRVRLDGSNHSAGIGAKVTVWIAGKPQLAEASVVRGYESSVEPTLHFGLGNNRQADSLRVQWLSGHTQLIRNPQADTPITLHEQQATALAAPAPRPVATCFTDITPELGLRFRHQESTFSDFKQHGTLPYMHSRNGFGLAVGDVNGDGLDDFFAGGTYGGHAGCFFLQNKTGQFAEVPLKADTLHEDLGVLLFDADNDHDLDLYVVSGSNEKVSDFNDFYQDRLYLNDGLGHFQPGPNALPPMNSSGSCITATDYDNDGDLDLFVGGRMTVGQYPKPTKSYILRNDSRPPNGANRQASVRFTDVTRQVCPELETAGLVTAALWTDFDNDNRTDLIVVGEWMAPQFYKNQAQNFRKLPLLPQATGLWNSLAGGDFDNDGDIDYVVGNLGLNSRYRASVGEPMKIVAGDFNKDGLYDPIMGHYFAGECRPSAPRDAMIQQIVSYRAAYKTYHEYGEATFDDLFSRLDTKDAYRAEVTELRTMYIENKGVGADGMVQFATKPLPVAAQIAPIYGMQVSDIDDDGNLDLVLTGNFYGPESHMGRLDAFEGLCLHGDGRGGFRPLANSGLLLNGDAKGLASLVRADGSTLLLSAMNDEGIRIMRINQPKPVKWLMPTALTRFANLMLIGNRSRRHEFYWGSGYLSASSRALGLGKSVKGYAMQRKTIPEK